MKATLGGRGMTIVALTVVLAGCETGYLFDVDLSVRGGNELRFLTEYSVTLATLTGAPLQCEVMRDQYFQDHARWRDEWDFPIRRVGTLSQDADGCRVLLSGFGIVTSGAPYVRPVFRFARAEGSVECLFVGLVSDDGAIWTRARKEGDEYVLVGARWRTKARMHMEHLEVPKGLPKGDPRWDPRTIVHVDLLEVPEGAFVGL